MRNNVGFTFDGARHPHLPGLLKARGYATGAAVSSYVLRGETGLAALFDEYEDSLDPRDGKGFADQQRAGGVTLAFAKRWLDAHAAAPFFYLFHIYEPHVPWDPPEPLRSRYSHPYDGEVAAADAVVGDLLDHLRRTGVYDRAIVIVTSDHGEGLGDHGEEQHSILLYREAIQVPLLVKLPGRFRAGERVKAPAQLADIAATVAELVGVEAPATSSGRSLLNLGEDSGAARALYAETLYPRLHLGWSQLRSVVEGRWHYVFGPRPELYDLAKDPRETTDLAAREGGPRERLRAALGRVPAGPLAPSGVDPAVAERLATLGYLGTVRDRGPSSPLPNPREMLPQLRRMTEGFRLATWPRSGGSTRRPGSWRRSCAISRGTRPPGGCPCPVRATARGRVGLPSRGRGVPEPPRRPRPARRAAVRAGTPGRGPGCSRGDGRVQPQPAGPAGRGRDPGGGGGPRGRGPLRSRGPEMRTAPGREAPGPGTPDVRDVRGEAGA